MSAAGLVSAGQSLTAREVQVLRLVADGCTDAEIGEELFLARDTVKAHVRRLLVKLGAPNRAAAVAQGYERGLLGRAGVSR